MRGNKLPLSLPDKSQRIRRNNDRVQGPAVLFRCWLTPALVLVSYD